MDDLKIELYTNLSELINDFLMENYDKDNIKQLILEVLERGLNEMRLQVASDNSTKQFIENHVKSKPESHDSNKEINDLNRCNRMLKETIEQLIIVREELLDIRLDYMAQCRGQTEAFKTIYDHFHDLRKRQDKIEVILYSDSQTIKRIIDAIYSERKQKII